MKGCLVNVVLILWYTSISSLCWNAHALNCCTNCLSCNISGGNVQSICIPHTENNNQLNISIEQELKLTCRWTYSPGENKYRWNISAPQGWQILLRFISERTHKIEAGNRNINSSEDASFNSLEDHNFHGVDEFLSITNMIWIEASINPVRPSGFNKTFNIVARTVKVTDAVDTQRDGCHFHRDNWESAGYEGSTQSNGSFVILCDNISFQHSDILISVFYDFKIDSLMANGSLQFEYVKPRNLMTRTTSSLNIRFSFFHCDSIRIRFDASGRMKLNISNVTVQGLMNDDDDMELPCMSQTSSPTTLQSATSPNCTSNSSLSPSSTSTTAEGNTSFTPANMTTWFSDMVTMTTERTAADSLPIFLIPTVSVLALFLLVFLAVLCICLRKGCHTKQSRGRESAPLDDPAFSNNEQHEYCEVRPSVKSPPDKTASGVTDQPVGHKNYAFVVTGPAMVMADEETVHSDDKTAKVKTPTANNKVLSNGPVYTLVDMEKRALDREKKADKARNRGNECVCNVDRAYATVELDEAFGDKGGQTEGKELNSSSMKPAPRSSSIKKDNSGAPMNQYEQMQLSDKGITDIHKTPECHTNHDEPELLGTSPTEPYDVPQLGFKSSVSSDFSKGDIQTKGQSSDDLEHAYQIVSGPSSSGVSSRPDSYPLGDYETVTVSPPVSPEASASLRPDSYPLSDYETVSPPMSPVAMASEQERPYDTLQRGPDIRKQTATSPTASTVDKKAKEEADHEDAFNVYNEIATPDVALSDEGSEAYQHLQRPLSKRPKAGAPLPEVPDEGYGRLDLEGFGASNQTDSQGPKTTQVDPMYAILEKPAEENVPDDDDPEYDLLDACM